MATVIEQLRASGAAEDEADRAAATIAKVLPVGRAIVLDDRMLAAARSGDVALLMTLLAPEEDPEQDELEAMSALRKGPAEDRETVPFDDLKRTFGL